MLGYSDFYGTLTFTAVDFTLVVASRTAIRAFDAQRPGSTVFPVIAGKDVQNIRTIAVDSIGSAVFWSDDTKGAISKVYLNGTGGEATVVWKGKYGTVC